tara:strand:- start:93 stop:647 length:555 start_codon:yes stop_codon:yes gene_type:complete
MSFATDFFEIPAALDADVTLVERVLAVVDREPIHGKALVGVGRESAFRGILRSLTTGTIGLDESYRLVESLLPPSGSPYAYDRRVFARKWGERLVRTQFSRMYNTAVLELALEQGVELVEVPHSRSEKRDSGCTMALAGRTHSPDVLLQRLYRRYRDEQFGGPSTVPDHPHCTHVAVPIVQRGP